jgi:three-Cys-motif partner protein
MSELTGLNRFGGEWSERKLQCIEEYTAAYLRVLQKQKWDLHYVDAFAGDGLQAPRSTGGEVDAYGDSESDEESEQAQAFIEGSALRALNASRSAGRGFDKHLFIEEKAGLCEVLRERVASTHPELTDKTEFIAGDANDALVEYIDRTDWAKTRSLVFLDPFGLEVRWDTVARLAATGACDVWYLFPLGVMRMMTNSGEIPGQWRDRLNTLFGEEGWYDEFYRESNQLMLFDLEPEVVRDVSTDHVVDYIVSRLGSVFPAVGKPAVLRNSKGAPLFALVFAVATDNEKGQMIGIRIANYLTGKLGSL